MLRELQGKRFPRAAYARRVNAILRDVNWWMNRYDHQAKAAVTPVTRSKNLQRYRELDGIWHALMDVSLDLEQMQ